MPHLCGVCDVVTDSPTSTPTDAVTASPTASSACQDDPLWHGKFSTDHTCDWIAQNVDNRCGFESSDGTLASDGCKKTCGVRDTVTNSPTFAVVTSTPTPSCVVCSDVPTPWMITQGYECATAPNWLINKKCNKEEYWINNNFCEMRCDADGFGYHDSSCCSSSA